MFVYNKSLNYSLNYTSYVVSVNILFQTLMFIYFYHPLFILAIMFGIFTNISLLFFIKLIQTETEERFINTSIVWILLTVLLHIVLCIGKLITSADCIKSKDVFINSNECVNIYPLFFVVLTNLLIYMFYIPVLYLPIKNIYKNYQPIKETINV